MTFTFEELKHKTVAELREIAAGIESEEVQGYTQLNKEHLLEVLCKALNIDMHVHHHVVGIEKTSIKKKIKVLKIKRDEALKASNHEELKKIRHEIHRLKNKLRRATV
ncbi:hypothetical protein JXQ31_12515 [candidate division KSB1 bacterium]|nr:hypothetical protein [candidate division KSB1 bacterium]